MKFLLYGANGYTGQLIAEMAKDYHLTPILAGRSADKIQPLAERLGYAYRIFDLKDTAALDAALQEVEVVLHAAGPFVHTARPMMEACLRTGTHYLDITGEIAVFEMAAALNAKAKAAGMILMPGVGFDVVPTDCLALFLYQQLPDATHLKLAFVPLGGGGGMSQGTATTMAENLGSGGAIRRNGKIVPVPLGHDALRLPHEGKELLAMSIPWGDVSTAFYTTGIPNITVYTGVRPKAYKMVQRQRYFNWLLRLPFVRAYVKRQIKKRPPGPTPEQLEKGTTLVWGEVSNAAGQSQRAMMHTASGYKLTAIAALLITRRVLEGADLQGFYTPAGAFGADLIMEIPGTKRELL
ncbi:MAG TPA: saccharopine dehydrogenase NADP-binding domain-containing protein [Saprospiraceae bacterium]|nr:saccharopine dehydrogenase NADP-binding domain-containing protein [Saprospiraceae bacterium]HMP25792.1 saccharopine dehydrogenase NADP-binding domain-containing protein [Saprospiraceae bacterium]